MAVMPSSYGPVQQQVVKAAQSLPASTTATLFTISGTVLIQFFVGLVTTAIQNQACNLSLGNTPTGGTAANTSLATATAITNKPVGTHVVPTFSSGIGGTPVVASLAQVTVPAASGNAFVVPAGTITWTTSATNTGQMQFYLAYLPVDSGATVT
jgi:hypothetical protein